MSVPAKKKKNFFKKIFGIIFSRTTITLVLILIQVAAIAVLLVFLTDEKSEIFQYVYLGIRFLAFIVAIIIANHRMEASYKISWLLLILVFPTFGIVCYLLFANKKFTKKEKARAVPMLSKFEVLAKKHDSMVDITDLYNVEDIQIYNIANYLRKSSVSLIYRNTNVEYYPWGELGFPIMLEKLRTAKDFIFMEYFIISEGHMWDQILEILKQKASEGVEVRLIYDDLGCKDLPGSYPEELAKFGITAYRYAPLRPILDIRMNNRDHRKILVIDGLYGFTGGINIADEYINEIERFGRWKDNVIKVEGHGVAGLTAIFLSNWLFVSKDDDTPVSKYIAPSMANKVKNDGYFIPYCDVPYNYEPVGENVYINLALKASRLLYITTPYLILDQALLNALCLAAKNGVDVRLVMPGIPDKKNVFTLSRSFYKPLYEAGVKIYEYQPGFIHQKVFLVDDKIATVGTINLDFRSLYLHCENGTVMYKSQCIKDIHDDFVEMIKESHRIDDKDIYKRNIFLRIWQGILKIFAPMM